MESRCHLGRVIRLDTVAKLGWSVDVRTHGIRVIIDRLLGPNSEWPEEEEEEDDGGEWSLWPWPKKGKEKKREGEENEGPVEKRRKLPEPRMAVEVEGVDGVCTVCCFACMRCVGCVLTLFFSRIASTGSLETTVTRRRARPRETRLS